MFGEDDNVRVLSIVIGIVIGLILVLILMKKREMAKNNGSRQDAPPPRFSEYSIGPAMGGGNPRILPGLW